MSDDDEDVQRELQQFMKDLELFFARYAERYMASDVDAVSAMYEAPMFALLDGRAIHLADRTAVRAHLADVMAAYARSGAARADIAALDSHPSRPTER